MTSVNSGKSFETLIVKSLNDHWSAGGNIELETSTFGSIYNNVVNPRFGSGGGGMTIIMN